MSDNDICLEMGFCESRRDWQVVCRLHPDLIETTSKTGEMSLTTWFVSQLQIKTLYWSNQKNAHKKSRHDGIA